MRIIVSENEELVKQIREKLHQNGGYCPCKLQKIDKNKCICQEFIDQGLGPCQCGLYTKIEI